MLQFKFLLILILVISCLIQSYNNNFPAKVFFVNDWSFLKDFPINNSLMVSVTWRLEIKFVTGPIIPISLQFKLVCWCWSCGKIHS